jgi:hypothetical protein
MVTREEAEQEPKCPDRPFADAKLAVEDSDEEVIELVALKGLLVAESLHEDELEMWDVPSVGDSGVPQEEQQEEAERLYNQSCGEWFWEGR